MKRLFYQLFIATILITTLSCHRKDIPNTSSMNIRPLKDTVGFAQYSWQMDSLMSRINAAGWKPVQGDTWKLAICPHDDYTYVGKLYPELCQNIKTPVLFLFGVAHFAAQLKIEDSLVFDNYRFWKGPWKNVSVSPAREELFQFLKGKFAIRNDSLHKLEHSLEAMIPFLQYFNKDISIIPILVPAMSPGRMEACGRALADGIKQVAARHKWEFGKDFSIVVTTDAVHYGNEDWGGRDMAFFGCDDAGNLKARDHEAEIIRNCFEGPLTSEKIRAFNSYTLQDDYHQYKWTWCGRYCIPVALYTAYFLNLPSVLKGSPLAYSTSITSDHIPVDDIGMGRTAIATNCHWVGYASVGYR